MEHFKNPKNMGEIEDADGIGEVGNPQCGDVLRVYLEVEKNERGCSKLEENEKFRARAEKNPKENIANAMIIFDMFVFFLIDIT